MLKNGFVFRPVSHSEEGGTTIKGNLHGGGYGQVGVAFIATDNLDIAEINLRIEGGVGIKGESTFTPENILNRMNSTVLYNELKDKEIETYWFYGTKVECKLFKWGLNYDIPNFFNIPFGKHGRMDSRFAVPLFSDTKLNRRGKSKLLAQTNASRRTYREDIGFMLTNKDNQSDTTPIYLIQGYTGPSSQLEYMFANLNGEKYKVDPLVKLMGVEMLAEPSSDAILDLPVKITDFKQTGSQYQENGFTHNDRTYSYKYEVAVTVELSDAEGVEDWGYVYKDPYGSIAHISLKNYGSPYTDTHYDYYRNESKSTVTLYEYVKYVGEEDYVYGEPKDYEVSNSLTYCPDGHHPHLIDLGLPSGTKWACCNVGTNTPEGFGGYYGWGETQEKSWYNWDTYQYGSDDNNCQNLGSDIAGTGYDVAHVQWGGSWVMPSLNQILELLSNCTYQWTSKNGVMDDLFSGPSGGTIFLPAAGGLWAGDLQNASTDGYYWSSSQYSSGTSDNWTLYFNLHGASRVYGGDRFSGHTVRPVSR